MSEKVIDWDDAFANSAYIPGSEKLPGIWAAEAMAYRTKHASRIEELSYGPDPRHRIDLILPDQRPKGLVVFIHGGYWIGYGKSDWTHFAEGARALGWAVALPQYILAPQASLTKITRDVGKAISVAAAKVEGPIRVMGHSAGGHLAARMACDDSPLSAALRARLRRVMPISGVHDLRRLLWTSMNASLRLTPDEAIAESPSLHLPLLDCRVLNWVGGDERPEFIRQSRLLAAIWDGPCDSELVIEPGFNHFSILDGLCLPTSPIVSALMS